MNLLLAVIGGLLIATGFYLAFSVVEGLAVGKLTGKTSASVAELATDPVTFWVFAGLYSVVGGISVYVGWLLLRGEQRRPD